MLNKNIQWESLIDLLCYRAESHPDKIAYKFLEDGQTESASLTYQELDRQARAIASHLQSICQPGERALLLYPSGLEFIAAFFGCLYAGVVAVPAYPPRYQKLSRLQAIIADAQAAVVLTVASMLDNIESRFASSRELARLPILATEGLAPEYASKWQKPEVSRDTLAFLQYTSGSTGNPKGVMVSHGNLLHNQQSIQACCSHTDLSTYVSWLPLYHDLGLGSAIQALFIGAKCILMPPVAFLQRPIRWLKAISRYQAHTSGGPNFAYDLCVQKVSFQERYTLNLSSWQVAFNGAEPIRGETLERFESTFSDCGFRREAFSPGYGLAESTVAVTGSAKGATPIICTVSKTALEQNKVVAVAQADPNARILASSGKTWLDLQVVIVNPKSLTRCEVNRVGEIWVRGPSVAMGYWRRPSETEQTFRAYLTDVNYPFLRTGDLGFIQDGELFVTGRLKDLIIIRGRNYYPQDIEVTVEQSHSVLRPFCSAAFSVDVDGSERLVVVAEVEHRYMKGLDVEGVARSIRQAVARQHELSVYAVLLLRVGSIPKTSSGKIQRNACRLGFLDGSLNAVGEWRERTLNSSFEIGEHDNTSVEGIQNWLIAKAAEVLKVKPIEIDILEPLASYGLDSLQAVNIAAQLENFLERKITPTIVYDYPNIASLSRYLGNRALPSPSIKSSRLPETEDIAIVGIGCRFPGANNPEAFWQLLRDGVDAIAHYPTARPNAGAFYDGGKTPALWGGFLEDVEQFDPQFFRISPAEAQMMDPQQRLLLEVSWQAIENGGQSPDKLARSNTGVFIGISNNDYSRLSSGTNAYSGTGNALSIDANRLSYILNLHGPSLAIDTACSSSLVAVHQACQSLLLGECNLALAGGVNLILSGQLTKTFARAQMMAADGRCKTFDAAADGYVRGEGCGVLVLKRLKDAVADRDNIQAIIRGSAVNQDGQTNGLTAPNGNAQQEVIRLALAKAGVKPEQISYVETHGTGTSLGDPIEVNALVAVLMEGRKYYQPCWIGSVKTNIGHTEAAAGIAGLIKAVLSLQHGEIPPSLHLKQLNPLIELENTPIQIPTQLQQWSVGKQPRLAGVSSFGFGGTNAHVILEEAHLSVTSEQLTVNSEAENKRPHYILTLSAKTEKALSELVSRYQNHLETHPELALADICFTANTGRAHFNHRLAAIASDKQELAEKLLHLKSGKEVAGIFSGQLPNSTNVPKVAFLFTGQGSQYVNMGRELYETQPVFRQALIECDRFLVPYLEYNLLEVLYPDEEVGAKAQLRTSLLDLTAYTQPALFAVEYALARLWQSWGIKPDAVMGHSVGEYVAATVAGVFSLEDALKLIATRGKLMQKLPDGGKMVAVMASEERMWTPITPYVEKVEIAAINGPCSVVISGENEAIEAICKNLESLKIKTKELQVNRAFHSPLMEPMLAEFEAAAKQVTYHEPQIPLISNVTGVLAGDRITTPSYWVSHVRQPVRFAQSMETLHTLGYEIFLEIGPKPILLGMGRQCLPTNVGVWLPTLRPSTKQELDPPQPPLAKGGRIPSWLPPLARGGFDDWQQILSSLGQLYLQGVKIDWAGFDVNYIRQKVVLPTYPFQRQSYWIEKKEATVNEPENWEYKSQSKDKEHPLLGYRLTNLGHLLPDTYIWETEVDERFLAYLKDNRGWGTEIVPYTAYIEMGLAAAEKALAVECNSITDLVIHHPFFLSDAGNQKIQVVLSPELDNLMSLHVYGCLINQKSIQPTWTLHATAKFKIPQRCEL
ncbi:MAG: beta-ketoacyl synthase N-terminal-like domain-containing protein [Xenococcaceae cyanobacterium]